MSKRPASYDIDQYTFEEKERVEHKQPIETEGAHMQGRKIYKIGKKSEAKAQNKNNKIDIKIQGLTDTNKQKKDEFKIQCPFKPDLFKMSQGLFSSVFTNPTSSVDNKTQIKKVQIEPPKIQPSSSLFGSSSSLFGSSKPSLFGNNSSNVGSLFSGSGSGVLFSGANFNQFSSGNLFGNAKFSGPISSPPQNPKQEDSGDSQQLQKGQQMVVDPTKSEAKFDYGDQGIIQKIAVGKFKKDKGDLIEGVEAILMYDKNSKLHNLIIRLLATKNIILRGLLLPSKSAIKRNGDNIDILVFTINQKKAVEPHRLKLQIKELEKQKSEFVQEIQKIIEGQANIQEK